jgi:hypothetical protein
VGVVAHRVRYLSFVGVEVAAGMKTLWLPRAANTRVAARDPLFAKEIEGLTAEQLRWLEDDLSLRARAATLASELARDEGDVYHQLKQLLRPACERLRIGLGHGRRRPRTAE